MAASVAELKSAIAQANQAADEAYAQITAGGGKLEDALGRLDRAAADSGHPELFNARKALVEASNNIGAALSMIGRSKEAANTYASKL